MSRRKQMTVYEVWRYNYNQRPNVLLETFHGRRDAHTFIESQPSRYAYLIIPTKVQL